MKNITIKIIALLVLFFVFGIKANAQCIAGFTSNAPLVNGQYGTGLVQFTDTSHASIGDTLISWAWDFGDGVTAKIKNPTHFYPTPGTYDISLKVYDNSSNSTTTKKVLMNVPYPKGCKAWANYTYSYPIPTGNVPTLFLSSSNIIPTNDSITSVLWTFGDGATSTLLNPAHTYLLDTTFNGIYRITTKNGCIDSATFQLHGIPCQMQLSVAPNAIDPTKFEVSILNGKPPYTAIWQQATLPWNWTYTPNSQLSNNGLTLQADDSTIYNVSITEKNGCTYTYGNVSLNGFQLVLNYATNINANYIFLQQGISKTVDFGDNSYNSNTTPPNVISQFWDFGDGTTSTLSNPSHTYLNYGSYTITYIAKEANGSIDTATGNINVLKCNYAFKSSIVPFAFNKKVLTAKADGGIGQLSYLWQDSSTTTQSFLADHPAYYSVRISDANGCVASSIQAVSQDATLQYNPHFQDTCNANFAYGIATTSALPGVNNALATFADEREWGHLINPHTYTWTYSDGYVDTLNFGLSGVFYLRPYKVGDKYDVTLTVTGVGCNKSTTQTVDFSAGACNLSPTWSFQTNWNLFKGQYPLKISAQSSNGSGTYASRTYLWSNGSTAPFIYAYSSGEYCVTITDSLGCSKKNCYTYYAPHDSTITLCGNVFNDSNNNGVYDGGETPVVNSNVISITGNGSTYNATVDGKGNYSANVPAGNYIISYSTTSGHNFTTPSSTDTIAKYMNVTATYGNNLCGYNFGISNNTSTIGGKLFYDNNSNGVLDTLETGIAYQPIFAGPYTVFTDANGNFNMNVIANNYSLTYIPQNAFSSYTLTTPGTIAINANTVGSSFINKNFGIHTNNIGCDLGVNLWPTSVVNNGFPAHYTIEYYNNGATSANNTITMIYDTNRTFDNASITPSIINTATHTLTWNLPTISAYTNQYLYVNFTANVTLSMNTPLTTVAHISNVSGTESLLANNNAVLNQLSVSSWDPNDKLVIRTNTDNVTEQNISSIDTNQVIEYMIRFQNLGNYQAINVRVVDEMSSMLDENSYTLLGGSHNCQVTRLGNTVTYKFDNIMLPTETDSGDASNGFVTFRIKANSKLKQGDLISDMAKIYFDYNQPVATPYSNLLMVDPSVILDSQSFIVTNSNVGVFPNPLSGRGFVKYILDVDTEVTFTLCDINGKTIMVENAIGKKGMNYFNLDVSDIKYGLYLLKVSHNQNTSYHKLNIINK